MLRDPRDDTQQRQRAGEADDTGIAQLGLQQARESRGVIGLPIGHVVGAPLHTAGDGEEYGLDQVAHIDEREQLRPQPRAEVKVSGDRPCHEIVVMLMRAIDTRGTDDDVWETLERSQIVLGLGLAPAVGSVRTPRVVLGVGEPVALMDGAEDTERAHIDELVRHRPESDQRAGQMARGIAVDAHEVVTPAAFGHAGIVDDDVPPPMPRRVL